MSKLWSGLTPKHRHEVKLGLKFRLKPSITFPLVYTYKRYKRVF